VIRIRMRTVAGADLGEKVLDDFPVLIGRDSSCGLVLTEPGISSRHVELDWDSGALAVRDAGSRNGTYFGKEKISQKRLELPCELLLGSVVIIELEAMESANAMAVRAMPLPKAFRRPEPPATITTAPPEMVETVVIEEAVVIEGWEIYWHAAKNLKPRPLLFAMLGLAFLHGLLHHLVFREGLLYSFGVGLGVAAVSSLVALITAAMMAVPGIIFRGKFDFKPLYVQQCLGIMVLTFHVGILRPAFLMEYFGYVAQALSLPLIAVCSIAGSYMFFFNTFSHKHERKLMVVAMIFAALAIFSEGSKVFTVDKQGLMREALMGKYSTARGLAGSSSEVKAVTDDIRQFGRKFPVK
jgi:hypothetical protein